MYYIQQASTVGEGGVTVLATTAPTPPRAHLLRGHLGIFWFIAECECRLIFNHVRQWAGQQPRTPPSYPPAGYGGYGHMSQMSPMGYQVQPCQPTASKPGKFFRCPMATLRQMVGSETTAGREGMTTAELTQGILYSNNHCIS